MESRKVIFMAQLGGGTGILMHVLELPPGPQDADSSSPPG